MPASARTPLLIVVAIIALAGLFVVLRPIVAGPQERTFEVTVAGEVTNAPTLNANEGDRITIRVTSDRELTAHLHGYDRQAPAGPGAIGIIELTADKSGSFELEDEEREEKIAELIVAPR